MEGFTFLIVGALVIRAYKEIVEHINRKQRKLDFDKLKEKEQKRNDEKK